MSDPMALSQARSRAYALFSELLLDGVRAERTAKLEAIPVLAEALQAVPAEGAADELAAAHHHLFAFEVPPHQGVFLDPEGLVGGDEAEAVMAVLESAGFHGRRRDTTSDHLGVILGGLSFLTGAVADAQRDGQATSAATVEARLREVMDGQLLRWLPAFAVAAARSLGAGPAPAFWGVVLDLIVATIADHRASLGELPPLPDAPALLDDPSTGLRRIAHHLATAALTGSHLGRGDIAALGRGVDLPHGFGSRVDMLEHVLRAAADYDAFPAAVAKLRATLESHRAALEGLAAIHAPLAPWTGPWETRLRETDGVLARLEAPPVDA